mgnify:CR=1 FL=1
MLRGTFASDGHYTLLLNSLDLEADDPQGLTSEQLQGDRRAASDGALAFDTRKTVEQDDRAVTIETIQKFVSDYYQLKLGELKSRNNSKSVAMPRQIAMYLCKNLTSASLPEIGKSFGGKHHSTVIHSIAKVEDDLKANSELGERVSTLRAQLQRGGR